MWKQVEFSETKWEFKVRMNSRDRLAASGTRELASGKPLFIRPRKSATYETHGAYDLSSGARGTEPRSISRSFEKYWNKVE